jgi:hypothetical protein
LNGKAPYGGAPFRVGKYLKATGSAGGFFVKDIKSYDILKNGDYIASFLFW